MSTLNNRKIRKTLKDYIVLSLGNKYSQRLTKKIYPEILDKMGISGDPKNASQFYGLVNKHVKDTRKIMKSLKKDIKDLIKKNRLLRRFKRKERKRKGELKKKQYYHITIILS